MYIFLDGILNLQLSRKKTHKCFKEVNIFQPLNPLAIENFKPLFF